MHSRAVVANESTGTPLDTSGRSASTARIAPKTLEGRRLVMGSGHLLDALAALAGVDRWPDVRAKVTATHSAVRHRLDAQCELWGDRADAIEPLVNQARGHLEGARAGCLSALGGHKIGNVVGRHGGNDSVAIVNCQ